MDGHGVIGRRWTGTSRRYRQRTGGMKALGQAWGLAVALSSLPWLGVAGGWLLDRVFDTFPLLLLVGGLTGVCLSLVCAYLATRAAFGRGRLDAGDRPASCSYPPRTPDARGLAGHGFHVLVVEPDAEVLAKVSRRLHEAGLQVAGAPSGKLALRVLEHEGAPDLVLADLPDMAVRSLVMALRVHTRAHLPVGYLTREPVTVGRYGGEPVLGRPFANSMPWSR
jgi:hypothetical protein